MLLELKIARKLFYNFNSSAKKRFSFLTIASVFGVMIGVMSILLAKGFINGFENELNKKVMAFSSHIEINSIYDFDGINLDSLPNNIKNNINGIEKIEIIYNNNGIISKDENVEGAVLTSFEENNFRERFNEYLIKENKNELNSNYPNLFIGSKLAEKIEANVSDTIIYSTLIDDNPYVFTAVITGILETGIKEMDENILFIKDKNIKEIFEEDLKNKKVNIWCEDISDIKNIENKLKEKYSNYSVLTVYDLHKNIFAWIELQKIPSPIIMSILFLVSIVNVISLLLTSIIEKRYVIGVLRTLGLNNFQTELIFLLKGLFIITIGIVLALISINLIIYLQNTFHIIKLPIEIYIIKEAKIDLSWFEIFKIISTIYLVSILILVIPIRSSRNISPLSVLK